MRPSRSHCRAVSVAASALNDPRLADVLYDLRGHFARHAQAVLACDRLDELLIQVI